MTENNKNSNKAKIGSALAGFFTAGPLGALASFYTLELLANQTKSKVGKWISWAAIGGVAFTPLLVLQTAALEALIPDTETQVVESVGPDLKNTIESEVDVFQDFRDPQPRPTSEINAEDVTPQKTEEDYITEEIQILAMYIAFDSLTYSEQITICQSFAEYGYLDIFYQSFAEGYGENPPSKNLFNNTFKNICAEM